MKQTIGNKFNRL